MSESNEPFDVNGERGYLTVTAIPDEFTSITVSSQPSCTVIHVGFLAIHVEESVLDRLEQAITDARTALSSKLAAAVTA